MKYAEVDGKLADYRRQIAAIREKMRETLAAVEPQPVQDYELTNVAGPVRLSELFGPHEDLILSHNMGVSCSYCTLWADGFNGVADHLANRAAFVVSSPDDPETQAAFKASVLVGTLSVTADAALATLFDHDLFGAAMRKTLAYRPRLDARLERQGLAGDTQFLVAGSILIGHSAVLIL